MLYGMPLPGPPEYFTNQIGSQLFNYQTYGGGLPAVSDPDKVYANITRDEAMNYLANFGSFEQNLVNKAKTDTSLIDQAREDTATQAKLAGEIQQRNLERYGANLTAAQTRQRNLSTQRGSTLGSIDAINNARVMQDELNTATLSDLINIGQGLNRSSLNQLGNAAQDASMRKQAYMRDKAAAKSQQYSTMAQLGVLAFALSDRRAKENIKKVGVSPKGVNIYEFTYKNNDDVYRGVMADEVPWAVSEAPNGWKMVDYNKVDVQFERVS